MVHRTTIHHSHETPKLTFRSPNNVLTAGFPSPGARSYEVEEGKRLYQLEVPVGDPKRGSISSSTRSMTSYSVTSSTIEGWTKESSDATCSSNTRSSSHKMKIASAWTWACCNCGSQAAMSLNIEHCPEYSCQHLRCTDCIVEDHRIRLSEASILDRYSYKRKADSTIRTISHETLFPETTVTLTSNTNDNSFETPISTQRIEGAIGSELCIGSGECRASPPPCTTTVETKFPDQQQRTASKSSPLLNSTPSSLSTQQSICLSEVFSPDIREHTEIETDMESVQHEQDDHDSNSDFGNEGGQEFNQLLESRLSDIIDYDPDLATTLIPEIYNVIQSGGVMRTAAAEDTRNNIPAHSASGARPFTPARDIASGDKPNTRKRRFNEDDSDDDQESDGGGGKPNAKMPRLDPISDNRAFACHFHKKDPLKYHPCTDPRYLRCHFPLLPGSGLRRIKYHYNKVHRHWQCNRCYLMFETAVELENHESSHCVPNPRALKEGINYREWEEIETLLKKRKKATEVDQWYAIWGRLFPNINKPSNPWSERLISSSLSQIDVDGILARFTSRVESVMGSEMLPREGLELYLDLLRTTLEAEYIPVSTMPRVTIETAQSLDTDAEASHHALISTERSELLDASRAWDDLASPHVDGRESYASETQNGLNLDPLNSTMSSSVTAEVLGRSLDSPLEIASSNAQSNPSYRHASRENPPEPGLTIPQGIDIDMLPSRPISEFDHDPWLSNTEVLGLDPNIDELLNDFWPDTNGHSDDWDRTFPGGEEFEQNRILDVLETENELHIEDQDFETKEDVKKANKTLKML